ncbi:VCBS repeat-containing protein, partial [Vicingaceae bacterium]|nr:VCBS repeat-containing protein [Vicingaceae bacterium]
PSHIRSKRNMASMSSEKFWNQVKNGEHFQYMVNTLQVNNGNATFSDIGQMAGMSKTDWSWGSLLADFDNDGHKDLVITNGFKRDLADRDFQTAYKNKREENKKMDVFEVLDLAPVALVSNYIFKNTGDLVFEDYTKNWGFNKQVNSHGFAYADLDNDGDLDLVVNNLDEVSSIYENNSNQNYLAVQLKGIGNNTFAIGTKVTLYLEDKKQTQELFLTRGFQSSVSTKLNFGLGKSEKIDKVEIRWPDQKTTIIENVSVNQILTVDYAESDFTTPPVEKNQTLFAEISNPIDTAYRHQENGFNDFDREILLPHILSRQGPCMAVADVNADGMDDLFIGGAKGTAGNLYMQSESGTFTLSNKSVLAKDRGSEDLGALFFDIDNDSDLDLYVASGGNDYDENDQAFQDRLYINDGKGSFTKAQGHLPKMLTSTKVVRCSDFDADGDLDLFIGGRLVPGKYPTAPRSYLLENNEGKFIDVTEKYSQDLLNPGMVTGAEFNDVNGDGKIDLTLVGEWMGFTIFLNAGNTFEKQEVKPETEGLWFSLIATDIDNDGDVDYVAGNLGSNSKFKASLEKPFNVYGNDFDKNGSFDLVLSSYEGETNYPVRGKECTSQQMPFITEKCPTYKEFAESDMNDLYGKDLDDALHLTVRNLYSSIFINDGKGNFEMKKLPNMAQISPILGMQVEDINNDGNLDVIAVGNMYGAEVETVRYDAGRGICLLGNGDGTFISLSPKESGFFAWDNIKSLEKIKIKEQDVYLVGINNGRLKAFSRTN